MAKIFHIENVSLKCDRRQLVKVMIFQSDTQWEQDWDEDETTRLTYPKNTDGLKKEIIGALKIAAKLGIDLLVFPELMLDCKACHRIRNWSRKHNNIIIIGGSCYRSTAQGNYSVCPVFFAGKEYDTHKIYPAPDEKSSIQGHKINPELGDKIIHFTDTPVGDFFIIICSDCYRSDIKEKIEKYDFDFLIVPSFTHRPEEHHELLNNAFREKKSFYALYANAKCVSIDNEGNKKLRAGGRSALFGIANRQVCSEQKQAGNTDQIPSKKLVEIKEGYNYMTFTLDITDKNPSDAKTISENPFNLSEVNMGKSYTRSSQSIRLEKETFGWIDHASPFYQPENFLITDSRKQFIVPIPESHIYELRKNGFYNHVGQSLDSTEELQILVRKCDPGIKDPDELLTRVGIKTADDFLRKGKAGNRQPNREMYGVYKIIRNRTEIGEEPVLEIKVYTTDYFTFKYMNNLYKELINRGIIFTFTCPEDINQYVPFFSSIGIGGFLILKNKNSNNYMLVQRSKSVNCTGQWHFSYDETFKPEDTPHPEEEETDHIQKGMTRALDAELCIKKFLRRKDLYSYGVAGVGVISNGRLEFEICTAVILNSSFECEKDVRESFYAAKDSIRESCRMIFKKAKGATTFMKNHSCTPESLALFQLLNKTLN